jgi:hypothetical protein
MTRATVRAVQASQNVVLLTTSDDGQTVTLTFNPADALTLADDLTLIAEPLHRKAA